MHQCADAVFTDGKRHCPERTNRCQTHDHIDDAEDDLRETFDDVKNQLAFAAQTVERKTKQYGKQQHLQNVTAGKCANDARRDDIHNEGDNALVFRLIGVNRYRFRIKRCRIDVHSGTRLHDVNDDKTNNQRDGTDNFKVKQCDCAGTTNRLHAFHARNARYDGTKDDRSDDHLNELNEPVAKRFHLLAYFRVEMAKENTNGYRCQDLKVKAFKQRGFHRVSFSKTTGLVRLWGTCGPKITPRQHHRNVPGS